MVTRFKSVGVTLGPQIVDRIDEFANARGVSRSEAIQISVDTGLPLLKLVMALSAERSLTILKHTQFALSLPVERQCPEDVNEPKNQTLSNVCECHA
jgi:hypothetical protein